MKLSMSVTSNLKTKEAKDILGKATRLAMRDTVVEIANDSMRNTPKLTGHNMRSIAGEVSGMGTVQQGADAEPGKIVDDSKMEGAVYSTSGYGGYLETGTARMDARPYMNPAKEKHFTPAKFAEKVRKYT